MKTITSIVLLTATFLTVPAFAKDKKKAPPVQVDEAAVALLKPFDTDGNYELDRTEFTALQAAFKAAPAGPLKQFDRAHDGELDDTVDRAGINNTLGTVPMAAAQAKAKAKAEAQAEAQAKAKAEKAAKAAKSQ